MARRKKVRIGDLFTIPLDEERISLGQVVGDYLGEALYFAVFDVTYPRDSNIHLDTVDDFPIVFLALSFDAKIVAGHWPVVGQCPVPRDMPMPAFKEMVDEVDNYEVVDFEGKQRRPATEVEARTLPDMLIVSPALVEEAVQAKYGLLPWQDDYDELVPSAEATTAVLFPGSSLGR